MHTTDFLIIGGGVMGLTLALSLQRRFADSRVTVIEKETHLAEHGSGRNSGVLHAGFYYTANSLKARFTREGNQRWTAYCHEKGLKLNHAGKVVVARNVQEQAGIHTLLARGHKNNVPVEKIDEQQLAELEPAAKTSEIALYSPTTASFDPLEIMQSLAADAKAAGITIKLNCAYRGRQDNTIQTDQGTIQAGYIVNAAGLHADTIARDFGFAKDYKIFPFKGLFLYHRGSYHDGAAAPIKRHIYPVPNLKQPFLGVHFTVTASGQAKIGPTAIPALWRENYQGLKNPNWPKLASTLGLSTGLLFNNRFGFKKLALQELPKFSRRRLAALAGEMVHSIDMRQFDIRGRAGIRAQPVNLKTRQLEMDFLFEADSQSFHLLNAVSPAFTCALPFSDYLVEHIAKKLGKG